jgi:hypothetical protein
VIEDGLDDDHDNEHERERPVLDSDSEFTHMRPAEEDYSLSEGAVDMPDDTESSDGQALGFEDVSDGDHEKDEDYRMEFNDGDNRSSSDSDEDIYVQEDDEPSKKPGKVKAAKVCSYYIRLLVFSVGDNRSKTN